jgi:hypothetical protein
MKPPGHIVAQVAAKGPEKSDPAASPLGNIRQTIQ